MFGVQGLRVVDASEFHFYHPDIRRAQFLSRLSLKVNSAKLLDALAEKIADMIKKR